MLLVCKFETFSANGTPKLNQERIVCGVIHARCLSPFNPICRREREETKFMVKYQGALWGQRKKLLEPISSFLSVSHFLVGVFCYTCMKIILSAIYAKRCKFLNERLRESRVWLSQTSDDTFKQPLRKWMENACNQFASSSSYFLVFGPQCVDGRPRVVTLVRTVPLAITNTTIKKFWINNWSPGG